MQANQLGPETGATTDETPWRHLLRLISPVGAAPEPIPEDAWEGILQLARQHELLPVLHDRLQRSGTADVPAAVRDVLLHAQLRSAYVNTRLYHHVGEMLAAMQAAGLPVIVLKGACLGELVYEDPALRIMGDVDLLVPPETLVQTYDLARKLGYAPRGGASAVTPEEVENRAHGAQFVRTDGIAIEWHWTLAPRPGHDLDPRGDEMQGLWARSRPVTIAGVPTRVLCPEDLLLHVCTHISGHYFQGAGLRACLDIALLIARYEAELDWGQVRERAMAWRAWHAAALALRLAHTWVGAALPEHVVTWVRETAADEAVLQWVEARMWRPSGLSSLSSGVPDLLRDGGAGAKLRVVLASLFPSPAVMAELYPGATRSWRLPLCYPRRWADVWRRHRRVVGPLLTRDKETHVLLGREAALRGWLDQG